MFKTNSLAELFVILIRLYQRYISPYKGFSCAHRALSGGKSCSHYALEQFQTKKPMVAYKATRMRMHACGEMYHEHMSKKSAEEQRAIKKRKRARYLRLINPRTYIWTVRNYIISNWPKRNPQKEI